MTHIKDKMRIGEVKYLRRFNLGNYEHEEIAVTGILDEEVEPEELIDLVGILQKQVLDSSITARKKKLLKDKGN